jgi:hypothetical protein
MRVLLVVCLLLLAALAGCFGSDDAPEPGDDPSNGNDDPGTGNQTNGDNGDNGGDNETVTKVETALADLVCDFTYPDGSTSAPCDNEIGSIEVEAGERPTLPLEAPWVCVWQPSDEDGLIMDVSIHWNPIEDIYGVYYNAPSLQADSLNGMFYSRAGETTDGNVEGIWYNGPTKGFFQLPTPSSEFDRDGNNQFVLRFYTLSYETETPELEGGEIRALWSFFDGQPYPVTKIQAGGNDYYFNEIDETDHATFPYDLKSFSMEGIDFDLSVNADHYLNIRSSFNHIPFHQCST